MDEARTIHESRRTFLKQTGSVAGGLILGASGAGILGACGSEDSTAAAPTPDPTAEPVLLRNGFPDGIRSPSIIGDTGGQRAIFSLSRDSLVLTADVLPDSFPGVLTNAAGESRNVTLPVRSTQIPRHYLALLFEPWGTGEYSLSIEYEEQLVETSFLVAPIADVPLVHPGQLMPKLETPTVGNHRGVNPICTRDPECNLHEMTVAEALTNDQPMALMVSSPRFCTTGICGPSLEILIGEAAAHTDMLFVHTEVYSDPDQLGSAPVDQLLAPTVKELGMTFEPSLIVVGADGVVRSRLDASMDQVDIVAALAGASA